jgi:hypothetical protein
VREFAVREFALAPANAPRPVQHTPGVSSAVASVQATLFDGQTVLPLPLFPRAALDSGRTLVGILPKSAIIFVIFGLLIKLPMVGITVCYPHHRQTDPLYYRRQLARTTVFALYYQPAEPTGGSVEAFRDERL